MSNYGFDERDSTTAVTREAQYQPQQQPQQHMPPPMQYGYPPQASGWGLGYPGGWNRGIGRRGSIETKPFFLTSEFVVSVIVAIGIAITAASSHAFGGWRAWMLITGIVASYNLSRGIAKSGTHSRAHDPREDMTLGKGHDGHGHDVK
jgi:hypothetical protein